MLGIKVKLKDAEKLKQYLSTNSLLNRSMKHFKEGDHIVFPITGKGDLSRRFRNAKISDFAFEEIKRKEPKKELLSRLTQDELKKLKTAFDTIGDIAIMEVDELLERKEKLIAQYIMSQNKNIKTVLKKVGHHKGEFRTQDMAYVAGVEKKVALCKENNVLLELDVEKVYFSPRLANERKRIAKQVRKGEEILVMFSGAAPYPVVLGKNTEAKEIIGIELNPEGHKWGLLNVAKNKLKNVFLYNIDAKDAPKLKKRFDRILMPLPKSAEDFLDSALSCAKKGTVIHFYDFLREENIPDEAVGKIDSACKRNGRKYRIIETVRCGAHAPRTFRVCVDFEIISQ